MIIQHIYLHIQVDNLNLSSSNKMLILIQLKMVMNKIHFLKTA